MSAPGTLKSSKSPQAFFFFLTPPPYQNVGLNIVSPAERGTDTEKNIVNIFGHLKYLSPLLKKSLRIYPRTCLPLRFLYNI